MFSPESRANMRISPMEAGDHSGKKAREEEEMKPEEGEVVMQDGDEGRSALVAVEAPTAEQPQMDVRMDVALLHCQACLLPLKPPVFKCEAAGHVVCCYCRGGHGDVCSRANTHCGELDAVVGAAKVPCPGAGGRQAGLGGGGARAQAPDAALARGAPRLHLPRRDLVHEEVSVRPPAAADAVDGDFPLAGAVRAQSRGSSSPSSSLRPSCTTRRSASGPPPPPTPLTGTSPSRASCAPSPPPTSASSRTPTTTRSTPRSQREQEDHHMQQQQQVEGRKAEEQRRVVDAPAREDKRAAVTAAPPGSNSSAVSVVPEPAACNVQATQLLVGYIFSRCDFPRVQQ